MWQSIPRTGSLLLRASRPHSFQRFPLCLLSSHQATLPASSGFPAASSLLPPCLAPCAQRFPAASSLLPPCHAPCAQRFPAASSPPSMPRSLRSAVSCCLLSSLHASPPASSGLPAVPLSSLHASLPASSVSPAASSLLPPCLAPCAQRFTRCLLSPPSMPRSLRPAVYPLSLFPPDPVSPPLKHNKIS